MGGGSVLRSEHSYPLLAKKPVGVPKASILKGRIEPFYKHGQYDKVNLLAYVLTRLSTVALLLLTYLLPVGASTMPNTRGAHMFSCQFGMLLGWNALPSRRRPHMNSKRLA